MLRVRGNPLTKDWLIKRYLFGLDLTDDNGDQYPDEVWEHAGDNAIDMAETNLDIVVLDRGRDIVERQDYECQAWNNWQWVMLNKGPIRRVTKAECMYGGDSDPTKIAEMPIQWVRVEDGDAGQIQIIPNMGTMGAAFSQLIGGAGAWLGLVTPGNASYIPGFYRFTYRAGFYAGYLGAITGTGSTTHTPSGSNEFAGEVIVELDQVSNAATTALVTGTDMDTGETGVTDTVTLGPATKKAKTSRRFSLVSSVVLSSPGDADFWQVSIDNDIPRDILHCLGMWASMFILNPAGDMIGGAGIASKSVSMDGLSQSVSTTSSPMFAGYGSRLRRFDSELESVIPLIRSKYRRGAMIEVG